MCGERESNSLNGANEPSDSEIAFSLARRFDEALFGEIYRRYSRRIYLWCYNYTHDADEAVDLSQEVLIKIFQNIASFRGNSSFSTWVYSITRNHCLGVVSKKKREWFRRMKPVEENMDGVSRGEEYLLMDLACDVERILELAGKVMREGELEAFLLHYRDGFTVKEITRILGCRNVTGARTLIQGARRKFRSLLDREKEKP